MYRIGMDNTKRWCSLGDSITYQNLWQPHIAEVCGLKHINCGLGSTTIASPHKLLANWAMHTNQRLGIEQYAEKLTLKSPNGTEFNSVLPNLPHVVTIMGGTNDVVCSRKIGDESELRKPLKVKNLSSFTGAYSYIIEILLERNPHLKIVIISLIPIFTSLPFLGFTPDECFEATRSVAKYYDLPFVDLYNTCGFKQSVKDMFMPDGVHPNVQGAKKMSNIIEKSMFY